MSETGGNSVRQENEDFIQRVVVQIVVEREDLKVAIPAYRVVDDANTDVAIAIGIFGEQAIGRVTVWNKQGVHKNGTVP